MSWVKERLEEIGFADVAKRLDRAQVDRERSAEKKARDAEAQRRRRARAKQKKVA